MLSMTMQTTNMRAIGVYIGTLRAAQNLTRNQVAEAAGTRETTVYRYERGEGREPDMLTLARVVAAVKGRGNDLMRLILEDNPSDDYARALAAEAQLSPDDRAKIEPFLTSDEETIAFLEAVRDVIHNKGKMHKVMGYISGLKDRGETPPDDTPPPASRRRRRA